MVFLISFSVLIFLLLLVVALGRRVADFLPSPFRENTAFFIVPILGLAVLISVATVYGWLSPFKTSISIAISVILLFLGIFFEKRRFVLFRDWIFISAFAMVVTIPIFAPAFRFGGFNPFNDSFTYLVIGQWLQGHAFTEAARASGFFPVETQVLCYQAGGFRMGSLFFLGFVQSLFHLDWSYYAYLPAVGLAFTSGCLALGGVIRQVVPVSRMICLALGTLPAFTMNGFVFGAQYGFFPQTFGLAFSAGLACLFPGLVTCILQSKSTWKKNFFNLLPLAVCCSAFLLSYNDLFLIMLAGIGLFLIFVCVYHPGEKARIIGAMGVLLAQVFILINIESIRMFRSIFKEGFGAASGALRFGWPMYWSPIQFIASTFGMKSPFQSDVFCVDRIISTWVFPVFLLAIVFILGRIMRTKPRNLTVLFLICINVILWLAFLKFRYATESLGKEVGYTFLQFKISNWAAPFNLGLFGIAIAWALLNLKRFQGVFKFIFMAAFVVGMAIQYMIVSQMFTKQLQDETMQKHSPFKVFLDLRSRVENIPKTEVIYLSLGGEHYKLRQMVIYTLSDRKLASKYDDDGYIAGTIPENERNMPLETANWMIQLKPMQTIDENPLDRVGPFIIRHAPFSFFQLESIKGAYETETADKNSWNWVNDSVEYKFRNYGKSPKAKVKFQFLLSGPPRTLFVDFSTYSGKRVASFKVPMTGGWGDYESPSVNTDLQDMVLRISADGEPKRLSDRVPRVTKFLIQNIVLDSSL